MKKYIVFSCLFLNILFAADIGSDILVTRFDTQQTVNNGDRIASFAALAAGFALANSAVIGTFDSFFAVEGNIAFSGGSLILDNDLILHNESQITNFGTIIGNNHVLSLSKNISLVPTTSSSQCFEWGNLQVCLNCNLMFQDCCITFTGNSTLDGRGNCLTIKPTCTIRIAPNASLLMKNIIIQGVQTGRIVPLDSTSTLSLKSVEWVLDQNYSFTQGHFDVLKQFKISGRNKAFSYESDQVSTIGKNATLQLDAAVTFSYQPATGEDRIQLLDTTSILFLKGATLHASNVGLQLEKGILQVDRESFLSSDGTNFTTGIKLGDGAVAANNISLDILPAAQLKITQGFVVENDA